MLCSTATTICSGRHGWAPNTTTTKLQLRQWRTSRGKLSFLVLNPCHQLALGACSQIHVSYSELNSVAPSITQVGIQVPSNNSESLVRKIKENLGCLNDGETNPSAYDTAWVARIKSEVDADQPQFPTSLDWILENQLIDGSWGESSSYFLYDRLVNTLACVLTLKIWKTGEQQIVKGLAYLRENIKHLDKESASRRTVGFELVFPSMLKEAKYYGLDLPYDLPCLQAITNLREKKIKRIPLDILHSTHTTLLYTLEALQDVVKWDQILKLQSRDGSFLSSPAATAVAYIHTKDKKCLDFLTTYTGRFGGGVPCQYPIDLLERIFALDTIQRLGIDRHFREEIADILDYIYKHAGKQGISWGRDNPVPDIDDTCMALRLLRLHGYPVSSGNCIKIEAIKRAFYNVVAKGHGKVTICGRLRVLSLLFLWLDWTKDFTEVHASPIRQLVSRTDVLEHFRDDDDGNLICFPGESHRGVSDMFNLYRYSQIAFPGEKILKEAKAFLEEYLTNCVKKDKINDKWSLKKSLKKEVVRALDFPWSSSFNRLEVREYIDQYGEKDVWIAKNIYWMYNVNNPSYLDLAKQDYNRLLFLYKKEIDSILEWWKACGFKHQLFEKVDPKEIHFAIAATLYEPEFSVCRVAYTKLNCLENLLSDLFKYHESNHDIAVFYQAVEKWDPQLAIELPASLKSMFAAIYDTLNKTVVQIRNAQGQDMFTYFHRLRVQQIKHYMKRREMKLIKSTVSFNDHMEGSAGDLGVAIRMIPLFLLGERVRKFEIRFLDENSAIQKHLASFLALFIDIQKHENMEVKEEPNAISLWAKEMACTKEEALSLLHVKMEEELDELVHDVIKPGLVSRNCRRLFLEHARIIQYFKRCEVNDVKESKDIISKDIARMFTPIEIGE